MEELPEIVRVVLSQASRMRRLGAITDQYFDNQVSRLEKEELAPRGLHLLVDRLPDGDTRFTIEPIHSRAVSPFPNGRSNMAAARSGLQTRSGISSLRSRR